MVGFFILFFGFLFVTFSSSAQSQDLTVGVSWADFQAERWKTDEAAIKSALDDVGVRYISRDAGSSTIKQIADIEALVAAGADAVIILAREAELLMPVVQNLADRGIPVISYDRLIEHPLALYVTFNNKEIGRIQARAVFAEQRTGNYVFIKGAVIDPNADFLFSGQFEVLVDALAAVDIISVGEAYTADWSTENARLEMERILDANDNRVDAVVASNDETAAGVIMALAARGLAGKVPVSGQDGEHAALNRIALGTQTVSVWKDARVLGRKAGEIAAFLAAGGAMEDVIDVIRFAGGPRGVEVNSYFLAPTPITKNNLNIVIDAGWVTKEVVCQGVEPGSVAVCN